MPQKYYIREAARKRSPEPLAVIKNDMEELKGISKYKDFVGEYGSGIPQHKIDITRLSEYDQYCLTPEVCNFLKEEGVSSFRNGYLWTLDPEDYVDLLNQLLDEQLSEDSRSVPFARSAFGDILFVRDNNIYVLNSSNRKIDIMTDELEDFVNGYLTDDWFYNTYFNGENIDLLNSSTLNYDECLVLNHEKSTSRAKTHEIKKMKLTNYLKSIIGDNIEFHDH